VSKFTNDERSQIQNIVANLTIKRIPDPMIIKHIFNETGKSKTRKTLWNIRQRLKKESYHWYSQLREGEYEYMHDFKERINEIVDLQRMHHEIIIRNDNEKVYNPSVVQTSLAELHKLNITLSNYFDVAPSIVTNPVKQNDTISIPQQETEIIV
jgi:ATP-dependent RNA circularization protein (DNA/RNA ligase family)